MARFKTVTMDLDIYNQEQPDRAILDAMRHNRVFEFGGESWVGTSFRVTQKGGVIYARPATAQEKATGVAA